MPVGAVIDRDGLRAGFIALDKRSYNNGRDHRASCNNCGRVGNGVL